MLNVNIGVLGHVDSGKTSLTKALSTITSTASLDKQPQSQARGITLDLGFSCFTTPVPGHLQGEVNGEVKEVQYTLVDCPGHASLLKTVIGGAQIIDQMLLVVDVMKGIQTQTAESIVIGEILSEKLIVVLNKMDLLEAEYKDRGKAERDKKLAKIIKKIQKVFSLTKFGANVPMVQVSANPGGGTANLSSSSSSSSSSAMVVPPHVQGLLDLLTSSLQVPTRPLAEKKNQFYFSVDHCFGLKGKGTVLTGTVLSGCIQVGEKLQLPSLHQEKKVKSIQMFRKPVNRIEQGDRAGVLVTDLDAKLIERGIACSPGMVTTCEWAIARVSKVRFFKQNIMTKSKLHITVGHSTAIASLLFFSRARSSSSSSAVSTAREEEGEEKDAAEAFLAEEYEFEDQLGDEHASKHKDFFVLLSFEHPLLVARNAVIIGSKLDADVSVNMCRLAFHGSLVCPLTAFDLPEEKEKLKIFKIKTRTGIIDRVIDSRNLICKDMFAKETDMKTWTKLTVKVVHNNNNSSNAEEKEEGKHNATTTTATTEVQFGTILGRFGKGAKFKVALREPLLHYVASGGGDKNAKKGGDNVGKGIRIVLEMKKYIHQREKKDFVQPSYV